MLPINCRVLTFLALLYLSTATLSTGARAGEGAFKNENNRALSNASGYFSFITGGLQDVAYWVFDYYRQQPFYLRCMPLIVELIRQYSFHVWHMNPESNKNNRMEQMIGTSFLSFFVYNLYSEWSNKEYTGNLRSHKKDGLLFFEVNPDLFSQHHVYHNLSKQLGIHFLQIAVIKVDAKYHAIVQYQKNWRTYYTAVNLVFDESLSDLQFLEPNCLAGTGYDADNALLLSIFSEEVIGQVFSGITKMYTEPNHEPSFTKGKHYSLGTEMAARRLEVNDVNGDNTFVVCLKHSRQLDVLTKQFNNSNDSLIDEAVVRSARTETGWFAYVFTVIFRQTEQFLTHLVLEATLQYILAENCSICLGRLSLLRIEAAKCGRHWFCAICWYEYISRGHTKCPICRK